MLARPLRVLLTLIVSIKLSAPAYANEIKGFKILKSSPQLSYHSSSDLNSKPEDPTLELALKLQQGLTSPSLSMTNKGLLSVVPNGAFKGPMSTDCDPYQFQQIAQQNTHTATDYANMMNSFFAKCGEHLHRFSSPGLAGLIEFAMSKYDFTKTKKARAMQFQFEDNTILNGFIAVKDNQKRPWVIAKCGVFCAASEGGSTSNYMMSLFDESPFNVIFLGNRTGVDHITNNQSLTVAGYMESNDFFTVSQWLQTKSPFAHTVDSIHALGISLAGSAALYAAYLEPEYQRKYKQKYFNSVISICPVVNLEPTLQDMFAYTIKGEIFSRLTWEQIKKVKPYLTEADDLLNYSRMPAREKIPEILISVSARYADKIMSSPFTSYPIEPITSPVEFAKINNFTTLNKELRLPTLIWASKDDSIVSNKINTAEIEKRPLPVHHTPNLGIVNLPYGEHCAFSTAYGAPTAASMLRGFILSNSPSFLAKQKTQKQKMNFGLKKSNVYGPHSQQIWSAAKGKSYANLTFKLHHANQSDLCRGDLYQDDPSCFTSITKKIYYTRFKNLPIEIPTNDTEAQALTRFLNSNLRITADGLALTGTEKLPNTLEWNSYDF